MGVSALGKPFFARCVHLNAQVGCKIYETRPEHCRSYRCAWHLGILGERTDRRPDHTGILFQFEQLEGKWHLGIYEAIPGAFENMDRVNYLKDIILTSKKTAHLPMGNPAVRIYPWGADIPPEYPIDKAYSHYNPPPPPTLLKREGNTWVFAGQRRELLMPEVEKPTDGDPPKSL